MRALLVGVVLVMLASDAVAQPAYSSSEGKYSIKFPNTPKVTENTTKSAVGELTVTIATYANSDGSTFMVSFTDFPATAANPENHNKLFAGIRDGVSKDGKVIGKEITLTLGTEKWPGREFTVEKGKQKIRFRVFIRDQRVYQVAVIGRSEFVTSREANAFFDSLELTK